MGMLGASFGVGFVLGPAIAGLLEPFGHAVPMLVAAGLAAVNWLFALAQLGEPERHAPGAPAQGSRLGVLRDPVVRRVTLANLLFSLAVTQLETLFAFFARVVRRGIARGGGLPDATWRDFPVGPADAACLDLVAVCRAPRPGAPSDPPPRYST